MAGEVAIGLRDSLERRLFPRRHTALLVAIVCAFALRPLLGDSGAAPIAFSIAFLVLALVALYNVQVDELTGDRESLLAERRRRSVIGWVLASLAVTERVLMIFLPTPRLFLVGSICWLLFVCFVTWCEGRSVLRQKEITGETISISISVYLLLGVCWALLYIVIFQVDPTAFNMGASATPTTTDHMQHFFPILLYFSFTTLATVGYGDITPLSLQARYAAVAEGIFGQLYLAILVARLVGMHLTRSADQGSSNPPRPS